MKIVKHKKGQFIILATLIIAIMIISIGTLMYGTVTYFKHERWQEYLMVIDNIELDSTRVVELSLANYTILNGTNNQILVNNLNNWRTNLTKAYPGFGVALTSSIANSSYYAYGVNINYSSGLANLWYNEASFSAANATFTLNMSSVGFVGYKFIASPFLRMQILDATWDSQILAVYLTVDMEESAPVVNLQKSNFVEVKVDGQPKNFTLTTYYSETYSSFIYEIRRSQAQPSSVEVTVIDARNIKVIANSTVT